MISRNAPSSGQTSATDTVPSSEKARGSVEPADASRFAEALQRAKTGDTGEKMQLDLGDLTIGYSAQLAAEKHLLDYRMHTTSITTNALDTTALIDAVNRYAAGQDVDTKALLLTVTGQNWPIDAIHLQKTTTGAIQLTLAVNTDARHEKLLRSIKPLEERLAELQDVKLDIVRVRNAGEPVEHEGGDV